MDLAEGGVVGASPEDEEEGPLEVVAEITLKGVFHHIDLLVEGCASGGPNKNNGTTTNTNTTDSSSTLAGGGNEVAKSEKAAPVAAVVVSASEDDADNTSIHPQKTADDAPTSSSSTSDKQQPQAVVAGANVEEGAEEEEAIPAAVEPATTELKAAAEAPKVEPAAEAPKDGAAVGVPHDPVVVDAASIPISALEELLRTELEALLGHLLDEEQSRARSPNPDSVRRISRFSPTLGGGSRGASPILNIGRGAENGRSASPPVVQVSPPVTRSLEQTPPIVHCRLLVQRCGDSKATVELSLDTKALRARSSGGPHGAAEAVELFRAYFKRHEKLQLAPGKAHVRVAVEPYQQYMITTTTLPESSNAGVIVGGFSPDSSTRLPPDQRDSGHNEAAGSRSYESRSPERSLLAQGEPSSFSYYAEQGGRRVPGVSASSRARATPASRLLEEVNRQRPPGSGNCFRAERYVEAYVSYGGRGLSGTRGSSWASSPRGGSVSSRSPRTGADGAWRPKGNASHVGRYGLFSQRGMTRDGCRVVKEIELERKKEMRLYALN